LLHLDEDRRLEALRRRNGVAVHELCESSTKGVLGRKYRHVVESFLPNPDV
jgi:hypothetical protein